MNQTSNAFAFPEKGYLFYIDKHVVFWQTNHLGKRKRFKYLDIRKIELLQIN